MIIRESRPAAIPTVQDFSIEAIAMVQEILRTTLAINGVDCRTAIAAMAELAHEICGNREELHDYLAKAMWIASEASANARSDIKRRTVPSPDTTQ